LSGLDRLNNRGHKAARPHGAAKLRFTPLFLGMSYIIATFVLFLFWPIGWPITNTGEWARLTAYVLANFAALVIGYAVSQRGEPHPRNFPGWRWVYYAGSGLSVLLLVPLVRLQTGRNISELLDALRDQEGAYNLFQAHISTGAASNVIVSLVSAMSAPFIFAVTPIAIIRWKTIGLRPRALFFIAVSASIALSIMRGTDREVANLFIVLGSALLVVLARDLQINRTNIRLLQKYWKQLLLITLFAFVGATITTSRKEGRLGGVDIACISGTGICADMDSPVMSWMNDREKFGISFFILEVCQGYYGLDLALGKDFRSTWGLGHAPPLMSIYTKFTGDAQLQQNAYTFRDSIDGWSDQNFWSTMIVWFANDVGFAGAIVVVGILAFIWGRSWRDATYGHDDKAAVMFCLMMIMIAYFPANNQVFINLDGYFTFLYWLFAWSFIGRTAKPRSRSRISRRAMAE
jgi:hypothetical protein